MKFSARDSPPTSPQPSTPSLPETSTSLWQAQSNKPIPEATLRQPTKLVADVLLEIMSWLALSDFLDGEQGQDSAAGHKQSPTSVNISSRANGSSRLGYSLVRASQVCSYWRSVALSNRSLWGYIRLKETPTRHYDVIDREFACRVQRAVGLKTGLYVAYTECPEHELQTFRQEMHRKRLFSLEQTRDLALMFTGLFPLLRDAIRRSAYLSMSGRRDRIAELMDLDAYAMPPVVPLLAPFIRKPPLLTLKDLTLNITDRASHYCPPPRLTPNLERLTIKRSGLFPHFVLAIPPDTSLEPTESLNPCKPLAFERLTHLCLSIPALHLPSMHDFLSLHALTLTSLTLDTNVDILKLHPAPDRAITLSGLRQLTVPHLTGLLLPHIQAWECPYLEELQFTWMTGLPIPSDFKTSNYPRLRKLTYGYPGPPNRSGCSNKSRRSSWSELHNCEKEEREEDLNERRATTALLVKILQGLRTLEHLVVTGWEFTGVWGEDDWMVLLTPKKEPMDIMWLKGAALNAERPENPSSEPRSDSIEKPYGPSLTNPLHSIDTLPSLEDDLAEYTDTESDLSEPKIYETGFALPGDGLYHEEEDPWDPNRPSVLRRALEAKAKEEEEVEVEDVWEMGEEFACPLLWRLEFRDCQGLENSAIFRLFMARSLLQDRTFPAYRREESPLTTEESQSSITSSQSSHAASSIRSSPTTPLSPETLTQQKPQAHTPSNVFSILPSDAVSHFALDSPHSFQLEFHSSSVILESFWGLYALYEDGKYAVPIPRRRKKKLLGL